MRILLVEDEDGIAAFVVKGLTAEGHVTTRAATGADALALVASDDFDVVLLDLLLPDAHGRDLLPSIRAARPELPVIVVSALSDVTDKVELLDLGADDYLTKPFALAELCARVRAATRQVHAAYEVTAGGVVLDTRTRVARRGDRTADLPSTEFALLEYLLRHPGHVLSRARLLEDVWGFTFDPGSNVVDVYVGYLRRKLDPPGEPSFIETVRGEGYRVAD